VTIIEPTRAQPPRSRRPAMLTAIAVVAVVLVVAGAVVLATRDDDTTESVTDEPMPATEVAQDAASETAAEIARGFVEAYGAFDAGRAITYLADDADVTGLIEEYNLEGNVDQIPLVLAWLEALDFQQILRSCEPGSSETGTSVRCRYDYHSLGSDQHGLGPFRGSYFDLTVRDGKIVQVTGNVEISTSSPLTWEPFAVWISTKYPADVDVMYDSSHGPQSAARLTEESLRLWEQRVPQYVDSRASASGTATDSAVGWPSPGPVTMVVDSDVAPDDLVALSFLVASPSVTVAAITITGAGEVRCERGLNIVLGLLERLEAAAIPVACGAEAPIAGQHKFPAAFRENAERAAGLQLPDPTREAAPTDAVTLLRDSFGDASKPIRLLTLGPLTNVAMALNQDASLADRIESIWIMGGAVDVAGNVNGFPGPAADNTAAEWNIYVDPTAMAEVLDAGVPVRLVSLDGTNQVPVTPTFVAQVLEAAGSAPPLDVLAELFDKNDYMTGGDYYLWDPLAAILATGHEIGTFTDAHLTVDTTEGDTSGATRRGPGEPNAGYLTDVEATAAERILLDVLAAG
jgi:inosine-uridine nucleoside N-ribohydrolase